ncbi:MAG: HNH endonuclease [Thermoanaerobaculia bacterium]|nr:HNH endonuclease [Thermoanaerobaculia bacterium]
MTPPRPPRLRLAVTDGDWFRFLRSQRGIDEVNFWMPGGGRRFQALEPGEPLLFKLHAPDDYVVGGGFFGHFSQLPCSLAWEAFGEKNGAPTSAEMQRRIERYRRTQPSHEDYTIGCIILLAPFFWEREAWIPAPESWAPNIVQGKNFATAEPEGARLWAAVAERLTALPVQGEVAELKSLFGDPTLVRTRLGQGAFRVLITDTYERRCAATGEKALPVLEAAHILPVAEGGQHQVSNGLLLRSDLHRLYDRGYITVTPDLVLRVSRRLRDEFGNGKIYFPLDRQRIWVPRQPERQPDREALEWHADKVFRP